MKKAMSVMLSASLMGAGVAAYCLMNKNTKKNAEKLLNTALEEANNTLKGMQRKIVNQQVGYFSFYHSHIYRDMLILYYREGEINEEKRGER